MNAIDLDLEFIKNTIFSFKELLTIVNAEFLAKHVIGRNKHEWIKYRDPDKNWYSNVFYAEIDEQSKNIITTRMVNNSSKNPLQRYPDRYIFAILDNLEINHNDEPYDEVKHQKLLSNYLEEWKIKILNTYNREEHIKAFAWSLLQQITDSKFRRETYTLMREILNLDESFRFDDFNMDGMSFTILDYKEKTVRVNALNGIWSHFTRYGYHNQVLPNNLNIVIPAKIYNELVGMEMTIVEIGPGVFDSLTKTKNIILPDTLRKIDWSFWKCHNLKSIEVKGLYPYYASFKSIDGVLYSADGKTLYAYPNAHGETYIIPEGVENIHKFAFKSCDSIRVLEIPSSIKHIGMNAFYRCYSLCRIICNMPYQQFEFDGFVGEYMPFTAQWYFIGNVISKDY